MTLIEETLLKKILVLDGAMGTMLQGYKFSEEDFRGDRFVDHPCSLKGNNDLLSLTQPDAIKTIHRKYFEAGADLVETNTFSSTSIGMGDYQMEAWVYEMNFESAKLARQVADEFTKKNPDKTEASKNLCVHDLRRRLKERQKKANISKVISLIIITFFISFIYLYYSKNF